MLKVKVLLEAISLENYRETETRLFKYTVSFLSIAVSTMLSGTAVVHLGMYNVFLASERCENGEHLDVDRSHLVDPVIKGIGILIFLVRSV